MSVSKVVPTVSYRNVIDADRFETLLSKAKKVPPRIKEPLHGQLSIARELRSRGLSYTEISDWLSKNGIPVHYSTICRFLSDNTSYGKKKKGVRK